MPKGYKTIPIKEYIQWKKEEEIKGFNRGFEQGKLQNEHLLEAQKRELQSQIDKTIEYNRELHQSNLQLEEELRERKAKIYEHEKEIDKYRAKMTIFRLTLMEL